MEAFRRCLVTLVAGAAVFSVSISSAVTVNFADSNLEARVRDKLGIRAPTPVTDGDMLLLTELYAGSSSVSDLGGLEYATNLIYLFLENNNISDISAVSGLTKLTTLFLDNNSSSDISAVAGLANLETLSLANNNISDISAICGLTKLRELYLLWNNISDVSAVSGLTSLEELYLYNNNVSDISAVSGLTNLMHLSLVENNVSDISAVSGLTNLIHLSLYSNPLNSAAYCVHVPLIESNNPNLQTLDCDPNPNALTVDCFTDLADFAAFAGHWLETGCDIPNDWCGWADLDHQDDVNIDDLAEFADYWLGD